jgi:hypothetical protein
MNQLGLSFCPVCGSSTGPFAAEGRVPHVGRLFTFPLHIACEKKLKSNDPALLRDLGATFAAAIAAAPPHGRHRA